MLFYMAKEREKSRARFVSVFEKQKLWNARVGSSQTDNPSRESVEARGVFNVSISSSIFHPCVKMVLVVK
jgi:hypothetical protein